MRPRVSFKAALIAAAILLNHILVGAAAEDPARFLAVTNWYATFTRTLRSAGAGDGICHAEWSFSNSGEIKTELKLIPFLNQWTDAGKTNQEIFFQLHDTGTEQCGDGDPTVVVADDQEKSRVWQFSTLAINLTETNYTLGLGYFVPYDATVNGDPFPSSAVAWTVSSQGPIVEPLPATGMVLTGQRHYAITENSVPEGILTIASSALANEMELLNGELVIEWTLTPVIEQVELVVDSPDYEGWLPKGDLRDWTKRGDVLYLTASLQTPVGGVPLATRAKNIKFELLNVSNEKGVCLNRPHQEFADEKADLRLETVANQPPLVAIPLQIDNGGKTATTADGEYVVITAGISSFDFGAYGEIKVTATVNGTNLIGYYKNDSSKTKPILLPKRQPSSFIADKWKKDNGVENLADDDDSDNNPVGDSHKGDGLSLYEEYRGFSENLKHIRLDPKRKDFFIIDWIKADDSAAGITTFKEQTGLNVHSEMRAEEFHAAIGANGELFDTWVNFNHTSGPHNVDQHGIGILPLHRRGGGSYAGTDPSVEGLNRGQGGSPGRYRTVSIDPRQRGWGGITLGDGSLRVNPVGPAAIAHELSHTCTVYHHGDLDPENSAVWQRIGSDIVESGQVIEVRDEDNTPSALVFSSNNTMKRYIGKLHGQHSGDDNCFMRYYISQAYRSTTNGAIRYLPDADEICGLAMCSSATGTGVNSSNHRPQARYGDAFAGRGNCKGQVCVSDAYEGQHNKE